MRELLFPNNVSRKHSLFLIIFFLNYYRCFNCAIYSIPLFKYGAYLCDIFFAFYFVVCAIRCNKTRKNLFERSIDYVYLMVFMGLIVGILDGQYIDYAIKGSSRAWLLWGIFYYFKINKLPPDYVLNLLKLLLLGSVFTTLISMIQFPDSWFGMVRENSVEGMKNSLEQRGIMRFSIPGKIIVVLFIFKEIQDFYFSLKKILRLGLLVVFLLMIGNRFPLAVCMIMTFVFILLSNTINTKQKLQIFLCISLVCLAIYIIPATKNIVQKLTELSDGNDGNAVSENNIRLLAATYFFTEFNAPDDYYHIVSGNGMAFPNSGKYSARMDYLAETYGFYSSDVGYCTIYIFFGIIGICIFLFWLICTLKIRIDNQYHYIKRYCVFISIAMICGGYWFEYFAEISLLSYVLIKSNQKITCRLPYNHNQ